MIWNCFLKSTLISTTRPISSLPISNDINTLFQDVIRAGKICDAISLTGFLNPIEEVEEEEDIATHENTILQEVIQEHLGLISTENKEDELEELEQPLPTLQEARQALQVLVEYTEGSNELGKSYSRALERLTTDIEALVISSRQQSTLDSWIT
jgi:hypothetical protein